MSGQGIGQILVYAAVLIALAYPLGIYMAWVYSERFRTGRLQWLRRRARLLPARPHRREQGAGLEELREDGARLMRALLRRPLTRSSASRTPVPQPRPLGAVSAHIALNTTASFITNTNWQYYGGEYTMSYLTQMAGLAVQNFVSAAVGMAVLAAVIRGFARRSRSELGNFWVDLYRSLVYILLPLSLSSSP